MRTRLLFLVALLTTLTAGVSFTLVQKIVLAQDKTALTSTFRELLYDQQRSARSTKTFILAKRSDGSTVRTRSWTKPGNRGVAEQRLILDLSGGEEVFIDGLTESMTTIPMSKKLVETYKKRPQCPSADESANRDTILGYEVVRVVEHRGDPNNMLRTESWLAPALDCFPLKTVYSHGKAGSESYAVVNLREALQVTVGEPAASLFQRPSGYVERSPSERRSEYYNRYPEVGQSCPDCLKTNDRDADEKYMSRQSDRGK